MAKIRISAKYQSDKRIKAFVESIPDIFDCDGTIIYQERNVLKAFCVEDSRKNLNQIVVKKYKRLHVFQRLIYTFFRSSKAQRAFDNSVELRRRGINTPYGIACLEQFDKGILDCGYYVSSFTDDSPIGVALEGSLGFDKSVADAFASFVATLHEKGILHHDLNSTNVLYSFSEARYSFSIIDINRMRFSPIEKEIDRKTCFDNLTRFTGKMDLYEYVVSHYIKYRGWSENLLSEAVHVKIEHDKAWRRRKDFLKWLHPFF
nr:hypothetical protein [uncultured Bacteroides sp.]